MAVGSNVTRPSVVHDESDFNGDGQLDLAVTNGDGVAILLGTVPGSFGAATNFSVGGYNAESVAVSNLKGGTGKSTIAVNLACARAGSKRRLVLIDADAQGTASQWAAQGALPIQVEALPLEQQRDTERWVTRVMALRDAADLVVIDCPPHIGAAGIDQRPGLPAALAAVRDKHAGVLLVAKRDRLTLKMIDGTSGNLHGDVAGVFVEAVALSTAVLWTRPSRYAMRREPWMDRLRKGLGHKQHVRAPALQRFQPIVAHQAKARIK